MSAKQTPKEYHEGYSAFRPGCELSDGSREYEWGTVDIPPCPYPNGTPEEAEWRSGWESARTRWKYNNPQLPARSLEAREARVANDRCPNCPGELDTGWECNACGFDAKEIFDNLPHTNGAS